MVGQDKSLVAAGADVYQGNDIQLLMRKKVTKIFIQAKGTAEDCLHLEI